MFTAQDKKLNDVPIRKDQIRDVIDIYNDTPFLRVSRNSFISMVLDCPPEIRLKSYGKSVMQSDTLTDIMREYYLPFIHTMYDWIKMFGIYPWKPRKIKGTDLYYPWIPPIGSGYITTYMDRSHMQQFRWYWNPTKNSLNANFSAIPVADSRMRFGFKSESSIPDLMGSLRSDIATLITEKKTIKILRESIELNAHQTARPQYVIEHKPPRNNPGDDNLTTLEAFGDVISGTVQADEEYLREEKLKIRTDALTESVRYSAARNRGLDYRFGTRGTAHTLSESGRSKFSRENAGNIEQATILPPDFNFKSVPVPKASINLQAAIMHFDTLVSGVMDFPKQLIDATQASRAGAYAGAQRFLNERIKDWIQFFRREIKAVFIDIHGQDLASAFDMVNKERIQKGIKAPQMLAEDEVDVRIQCTPIASPEQLRELYEVGVVSIKTYAKYVTAQYAISPEDIDIQPQHLNPLGVEQQQSIESKKRPRKEPKEDPKSNPRDNPKSDPRDNQKGNQKDNQKNEPKKKRGKKDKRFN